MWKTDAQSVFLEAVGGWGQPHHFPVARTQPPRWHLPWSYVILTRPWCDELRSISSVGPKDRDETIFLLKSLPHDSLPYVKFLIY